MNKLIICLLLLTTTIVKSARQKRECKPPITTVSGSAASTKKICAGDLIFEDNFDKLDSSKWKHEVTLWGGGNQEFQWYVNDRNNTYVKNSQLFIKPTLTSDFLKGESKLYSETINLGTSCTNYRENGNGCKRTGTPKEILNPIRSGLLKTQNLFAFKYGRVEIRAKMPAGDWLWPGFWFLPQEDKDAKYGKYGIWPNSGEIDLIESRGNRNLQLGGKNIGTESMGSTLHWGLNKSLDKFMKTHYELYKPGNGFNTVFRTYELIWTQGYLRFKVDGQVVGTADPGSSFWNFGEFPKDRKNPWEGRGKLAPFDQPFYIILNLAVGGKSNYFPDQAKNYPKPKPWLNTAQYAMTDFWKGRNDWLPTWKLWENNAYDASVIIDYVRVYAL